MTSERHSVPEERGKATTGWIVGAYAAAPSRTGWNPADEAAFYNALVNLPGVVGFEVPFADTLHKADEGWLLSHLPPDADIVVTTAPGTSDRVRASAQHGLASTVAAGLEAALIHTDAARAAVHRLNDALGRKAVLAVELHSAPPHIDGASTSDQLQRSLEQIATWDWCGARIVIEHCDAARPGQKAAKGYLSLDDEIRAVTDANRSTAFRFGVGINWGRSVIEMRDADAGRAHTQRVQNAGLLAGLIFSGASDSATRFGGAWADVHVPVATSAAAADSQRHDLLEPTSLLTAERIVATLHAAGEAGPRDYRGVKVAAPPAGSVADRIEAVAASLAAVQHAELTVSSA